MPLGQGLGENAFHALEIVGETTQPQDHAQRPARFSTGCAQSGCRAQQEEKKNADLFHLRVALISDFPGNSLELRLLVCGQKGSS
jgi:hypothetical protein